MTDDALDDDGEATAGELALGLLDGEERAAALRRILADPDFAAAVERWRLRFAQLFDLWPDAEPPEGLIERIDLSLGGPVAMRGRRLPWPLIATVATAIAAMLIVVVALRPSPPPAASFAPPTSSISPAPVPTPTMPQPLLVAALGSEKPVPVVFEPATNRLRLAGSPPVAADRVAQLWVIGADARPRSLGLIGDGESALVLAPGDAARLVAGATLAVSAEPPGGSPAPTPTGPVVATGALRAV